MNGDAKVGPKPNLAALALHRHTTCSISRSDRLGHVDYVQNLPSASGSHIIRSCQVSIVMAIFPAQS